MSIQHQKLASGEWEKLSFFEQMANIGSEVIRAVNWRKKGRQNFSLFAADRALELLFLAIEDRKNASRLSELTRLYEVIADNFYGDNFVKNNQGLVNYFTAFTYAARLKRSTTAP